MKIKISLSAIALLIGINSIAQSRLDSLINLRKTDKLDGKVPTLYTPGHKDIAKDYQTLITDAINYYEAKYKAQLNVKLIVLDSAQWIREAIPYGFVIFARGWIVMNTGMSYETFKQVYGTESFSDKLDEEVKRRNIPPVEVANSILRFFSIHELGHHFIGNISNAKTSNRWIDELASSYFSYEYFINNRPAELMPFELYCQINTEYYKPKYSTIAEFNDKYTGTGIDNYAWYHCNIYFMTKSLYECQGKEFISTLEQNFPKKSNQKFTPNEMINVLDTKCNGTVSKWVTELEIKK